MTSLIVVEGLTKEYRIGEVILPVLRGISIEISAGDFVAVMGPSGSGKSTFMNILGCLDTPTGGRYLLGGCEVSHLSRDELALIRNRQIGFVFQSFNLLPRLSGVENVELPLLYNGTPPHERRSKSLAALRAVGLEGREAHQPRQLSGGEQQRVAIARALVNEPALLLADEPTGNLDTATSAEIMALFQQVNRTRGVTIVLVTHDSEIARYAGGTITFRDGRVIADEGAGRPAPWSGEPSAGATP
jgi:putative ABC transport system ATP-binding protein